MHIIEHWIQTTGDFVIGAAETLSANPGLALGLASLAISISTALYVLNMNRPDDTQ